MMSLLLTSLIWAFSFGLIKRHLSGLDAHFVAWMRLAISFLVFLPFLRLKDLPFRLAGKLLLLGAVQFGLMYLFYIESFRYLQAHQVALFTIFTPLYVTWFFDLLSRRFHAVSLVSALMAVAGAAIIMYAGGSIGLIVNGFLLVQASNVCFALGQVVYKRMAERDRRLQSQRIFAILYLGAAATAILSALLFSRSAIPAISLSQGLTLLYLGALASGLGFFLWNRGAIRVSSGVLAVFNNVKVPLAVVASLLFFGERSDPIRLLAGSALMVAGLALLSRRRHGAD